MKLTWFGGTTLRIYSGGMIVVLDPAGAPAGIDAAELVAGADLVVGDFGAARETVDLASWKPQKPARPLDDGDAPVLGCWSAGRHAVLIEAPGEPVLLLARGALPALGRWADGAVVVLFGDGAGQATAGLGILAQRAPRLLALTGDESAVDLAIGRLRGQLDGTSLVALEAGLALEI